MMSKRRKYDIASFRLAIDKVGTSPKAIADEVGCSTTTVYRYLEKYPTLKSAYDAHGGEVEKKPRHYEAVKAAIDGSRGIYAEIARKADVSRGTVVNYMRDYPDLATLARAERGALVDDAENALADLVEERDGPSVRFVLSTLGADRGYANKQNIHVTGVALSPETVRLLEGMGKDPQEAMRLFEDMVRAQAEKSEKRDD